MKRWIVFAVLLVVGCAHFPKEPPCYRIVLTNDTDKTVTYHVYQPEHNFNMPWPISRAVGELEPSKSNGVCFGGNKYFIEWREYRIPTPLQADYFTLNRDREFTLKGGSEK